MKILITGSSVNQQFIQRLTDAGHEVDNTIDLLSEDQLAEKLRTTNALLLGGDEFVSSKALQHADDLKVIAYLGMGYTSGVDIMAAKQKGIAVTYTPNTLSVSTAEFTLGHLLNLRRTITAQNNTIKHGNKFEAEKSYELARKRLGIIGLGGIGCELARMAVRGLNMEVVYFSRTQKPNLETELGIVSVSLDELLRTSDAVAVLVPDTPETRGMIGKEQLASMKPGALLINTARPFVVEPHALKESLENGHLGGASMDNYYGNPPYPTPQDDPYGLLSLPDDTFVVTAWTGSFTHEARNAMADSSITSILNILAGRTDPNIVPEMNR